MFATAGFAFLLIVATIVFQVVTPGLDVLTPAFDADNFERTKKWAVRTSMSLREVNRKNNFVYNDRRAAVEKEFKSLLGRKVTWAIRVKAVESDGASGRVCFNLGCDYPMPDSEFPAWVRVFFTPEDPPPDARPTDVYPRLIIGETISEDAAKNLMPGDAVTVEGEISVAYVGYQDRVMIGLQNVHAR